MLLGDHEGSFGPNNGHSHGVSTRENFLVEESFISYTPDTSYLYSEYDCNIANV